MACCGMLYAVACYKAPTKGSKILRHAVAIEGWSLAFDAGARISSLVFVFRKHSVGPKKPFNGSCYCQRAGCACSGYVWGPEEHGIVLTMILNHAMDSSQPKP